MFLEINVYHEFLITQYNIIFNSLISYVFSSDSNTNKNQNIAHGLTYHK